MVSFLGSLIITLILVVIRVNSKSFPQNYLDDDYASRRLARWNMLGALRTQDTSPDNAITEIVEEKRDDLPGSNIVVERYRTVRKAARGNNRTILCQGRRAGCHDDLMGVWLRLMDSR